MEPYAASYAKRVKSLRFLHEKGLKTWISMEPYPTPNLVEQNLPEILQEISFADRIIFGKLNYNVKSTQFVGSRDFYQEHADMVKNFCKDNGIEYHIKYGTQKKDSKRTEKNFGKENQIRRLGGILPVPI